MEYVLLVAIIGLVVVFAGPPVAGAIRNQFSAVTNTVDVGTNGDTEGGGSGGGSADSGSTAELASAVSKDAKDWTLDEQKAAADDIAKNGTASAVYAKAKAAMDAGTTWSVKLTNDETLTYRIIGINHDNLAYGSGKAGLTFLTTSTTIKSRMNATARCAGGWEKSEIRQKMNSGEIWNLMPADFQGKVKAVAKLTNNVGGGDANKNAAVTATTDKLFLLSYSEIVETPYSGWSAWSWIGNEGTQYEAFRGKVTNNAGSNAAIAIGSYWWERSAHPDYSTSFLRVGSNGSPWNSSGAADSNCVCPAFSF